MTSTFPLPFYPTATLARRAVIRAYEAHHAADRLRANKTVVRDATGSEVKQKDSELTITDRQRSRLAKVREALATGERIYQKDANTFTPDSGGLAQERLAAYHERLKLAEERTAAERLDLEEKWSDRELPRQKIYLGVNMLEGRLPDSYVDPRPTITTPDGKTIPNPDYFICNFCDTPVHHTRATHGQGPLRKGRKLEVVIIDGIETVEERVIHFATKVVACPDCCLRVTKVRFPESRG